MIYISKFARVILPNVQAKSLKPLSSLISPRNILIPMLIVSILSQITDNLKHVLNLKEIQNLSSVKLYMKVISSGISSVSLSALLSLSKTLGPELETLSLLNPTERLFFLRKLQKKIINDKGPGKIIFRAYNNSDILDLAKHRKGLSMQYRSLMISTSIFLSQSIVSGSSVGQITLESIIYSSKLFWVSLGLEEDDFEFLVKKEAWILYNSKNFPFSVKEPKTVIDSIVILFFSELQAIFSFKDDLIFSEDFVVFKNKENITLLEKELGFIVRLVPLFYDNFEVSTSQFYDSLIRMSLDQRKNQSQKFLGMTTNRKVINNKFTL